uniref:Uncharacterized protein n=1 Tax=Anguilla anguilla TaxID=7936 RepID=A0A0E9VAS3_ANGAN
MASHKITELLRCMKIYGENTIFVLHNWQNHERVKLSCLLLSYLAKKVVEIRFEVEDPKIKIV